MHHSTEQESGITIAEMNDKLAPLDSQVENLRNDVTYKLKVFDKIHQRVLDSMQACEISKADISKCTTEVAQKVSTRDTDNYLYALVYNSGPYIL